MKQIQVLLVEDEILHRLNFKEYITTLEYPVSFYMACGESEGLSLAQKFNFDVIILDLELHQSDGDGIDFLKKLKQIDLKEIPYIVVITNNNSLITRQIARDSGADYIFWKKKPDYSPKLVMDFVHNYYSCKISATPDGIEQVSAVSLEDDIYAQINKVGINNDMSGKKYIIDSIAIVAKSNNPDINLSRDVFPIIAKKYAKSVHSIDTAIERAINKAWCITDDNVLAEHYRPIVSGAKGTPTNKEFIFYYAHQVKDSCKAC
jgi:two-component system response regulator (stage 0 sporulation protein A)